MCIETGSEIWDRDVCAGARVASRVAPNKAKAAPPFFFYYIST